MSDKTLRVSPDKRPSLPSGGMIGAALLSWVVACENLASAHHNHEYIKVIIAGTIEGFGDIRSNNKDE